MAKKEPEKIRVRITASQVVHYDQIVEMTPEEWEQYKEKSPSDHTDGYGDCGLDLANIHDAFNIEDFDAEVVDEHGKPTGDRYGAAGD